MGRVEVGRAAIVERWRAFLGHLPFVHQVPSGGLIDLTGRDQRDRATGRWYVTEYGASGNGPGLLTLGHYHDEYVRSGDQWRFQSRRFAALYMGPPDLSAAPHAFPTEG